MAFGIVWMSCQAVMPAVLGRAIDRGVADRDQQQLLLWAGVMLLIGLLQAVTGIMRHRFAVTNWLTASYRIVQLTTRQSVRLGGSLPRKVSTGEVIAIGTTDLSHIGNVMDVTARFAGAIVSFLLVSAILLTTSVQLGLVVLVGVPLLLLLMGPILKPLQARSATERQMRSDLSNTGTDIVSGLRVLRGIGGEGVFLDRYRRESQATRTAAVNVAKLQSVLDALQVFLPGIFVVLVVWLGARSAVTGDISAGELVAFYGYSAFLMLPLRTRHRVRQQADPRPRRRLAACAACWRSTPDVVEPASPAAPPRPAPTCTTPAPGSGVRPGLLTAIVSDQPDDSALLADRLGLCAAEQDDDVHLGGVPLTSLPPRGRARADHGVRHRRRPLRGSARPTGSTSAATATSRRRSSPRPPRTSSRRCRTASTPWSPRRAAPSPAASASDWSSPAPSRPTPRSWCWSSRRVPSTPTPRPASRPACGRTARAARPWSPR